MRCGLAQGVGWSSNRPMVVMVRTSATSLPTLARQWVLVASKCTESPAPRGTGAPRWCRRSARTGRRRTRRLMGDQLRLVAHRHVHLDRIDQVAGEGAGQAFVGQRLALDGVAYPLASWESGWGCAGWSNRALSGIFSDLAMLAREEIDTPVRLRSAWERKLAVRPDSLATWSGSSWRRGDSDAGVRRCGLRSLGRLLLKGAVYQRGRQ